METILVLRGGALGDFIVTLPALSLLRERWPKARIEFVGNAAAARLALARGMVDAVHSQHEARWAGLFAEGTLPGELEKWITGFDLVLSYWPDPDGILASRFPRSERQTFLCASAMPTRAPAAAHYCEPLRVFGLAAREYFVPLSPLARARSRDDRREGRIAIHPGSGSPRKNWPADKWRQLIERLPAPVSLILGEAELDRIEVGPALVAAPRSGDEHHSHERIPPNVLRLINRPLEELVDHFASCRLFLGHDSGISHLAAACGVRCVLLFGPTAPEIWAPPVPNVRVVRQSFDLASLPVDAVWRAVEEALAGQT
jgi:heptosyltransferase-3